MADCGKCEHSITPGWEPTSEEKTLECDKGSLSFTNATYVRSDATKDTSVQLKLSFVGCNKLTILKLVTNARFVEVSVMKDSLLKYIATVRGSAPETDSYQSEFPLFEGQFSDETCEFRELHLKFLSIKPAPGQDSAQPVQLVLKSLVCEYTEGTPDSAPPLQQGPGGLGGMGGMGGGGGMEMMAMMAMSMMGGGMGGGMGGKVGISIPGASAPLPQTHRQPPAAEKPTGENRNAVIEGNAANGASAEPKITPTSVSVPAPAPKPIPTPAPAPAVSASNPAAGLDAAQLASIMWTVKSTMIDEISQLLDRKLAPVMARLDGIDAKLRTLETEVRARSNDCCSEGNTHFEEVTETDA